MQNFSFRYEGNAVPQRVTVSDERGLEIIQSFQKFLDVGVPGAMSIPDETDDSIGVGISGSTLIVRFAKVASVRMVPCRVSESP